MGLAELPEEILVHIISYLDTAPRSKTRFRYEPRIDLFDAVSDRPLKSLSVTSKLLRRVTLSALFKHGRLDSRIYCATKYNSERGIIRGHDHLSDEHALKPVTEKVEAFFGDFVHCIKALELQEIMTSILFVVDEWVYEQDSPYVLGDWDSAIISGISNGMAGIFRLIEPTRIVALLSGVQLGLFIGCLNVRTYFKLIDRSPSYQMVELDRGVPIKTMIKNPRDADYGLATKVAGSFRLHHSSLLHIRRWQHIGFNEGSFLSHYGSLEWFERGAPREIPSLLIYLFPQCCGQYTTAHTHRFLHVTNAMSFVDSFSYTAIFPPDDHLLKIASTFGIHQLQFVRQIDLQLAPRPNELGRILSDDSRVGRADLTECWDHVAVAYQRLRRLLRSNHSIPEWRMKTVVCQDDANESLRSDLRERFSAFQDGTDPAVHDEWSAWGKTWRLIETPNGDQRLVVSE